MTRLYSSEVIGKVTHRATCGRVRQPFLIIYSPVFIG